MQRALDLAAGGLGSVNPNPLVGSIVVYRDTIIGEGWHKKFGGPHAEVNAINAVKDKKLLSESEVFVTLEPCSHFGKTPPCTDLLIEHNFKRVIVAMNDPNPLVSGKGIKKLQDHGIEVVTQILEGESRRVNRRFITLHEKNRPYVVLKWAQTSDGFMARENYDSKWISSDISRKLVHKWRSEEDAILVGRNTVFYDNPLLNVRDWNGKNPLRIVLDPKLSLPTESHVFNGPAPTLVYNLQKDSKENSCEFVKIASENFMGGVLSDAAERGISSIFVEGGAASLRAFLEGGLWDEARVFVAPVSFEKGIKAPEIKGSYTSEKIGVDHLFYYKNN